MDDASAARKVDPRQQQARALGDPTRHAIFRALEVSEDPVPVSSLTTRFHLNHNAIRQHLAKLREAGLVTEELAPQRGRGRPAYVYRLSPAASAWLAGSPYERLSMMLLELKRTGRSAREVGRVEGRRTDGSGAVRTSALSLMEREMGRRGFEPEVVPGGTTVEIVLHRCPFVAAATADPDVVCDLHRGLAEGIVEATESALQVELTRRPPSDGGCRLLLRRSVRLDAVDGFAVSDSAAPTTDGPRSGPSTSAADGVDAGPASGVVVARGEGVEAPTAGAPSL